MTFRISAGLISLLWLPAFAAAQKTEGNSTATAPPEKLDFSKFPGAMVEKVVVPVPAEIFSVLDKLDEPDWTAQIQLPEKGRITGSRIRLALAFGGTVAEGFVAVQAEESDSVQEIGRRVLNLADALALQDAVVPHCQSIIDAAGESEWKKVREELDRTQQTVRTEMEQLQDEDLATLVSLGGWIRGTFALTSLISDSYTTDKAELLNQPDLIRHFRDSIAGMDEKVRDREEVSEIAEGLDGILEALANPAASGNSSEEIPASAVLQVGEICGNLLNRFYFEKKSGAAGSDPSE